MRIEVTPEIAIDDAEITLAFIQASGPGGQNVNKVATAVQLRFDARQSPSLPDDMKARLAVLAGSRMTRDGVLVIAARRFRSQERNRQDALSRLLALLHAAAERPAARRPTRPSRAARQRRLASKARQAARKQDRRTPRDE
jgi:ribosome-associated protein